jgi:hypothetical protein
LITSWNREPQVLPWAPFFHPRLGDDGDFDRLITAAHARGLHVLLDGVSTTSGAASKPSSGSDFEVRTFISGDAAAEDPSRAASTPGLPNG